MEQPGQQSLAQVVLLENQRLAVSGTHPDDDVYRLPFGEPEARDGFRVAKLCGFDRTRF